VQLDVSAADNFGLELRLQIMAKGRLPLAVAWPVEPPRRHGGGCGRLWLLAPDKSADAKSARSKAGSAGPR